MRRRDLAFLLIVALAGCGGAERVSLAPLTGSVTLDGKPLEAGMIVFTPAKGRPASGKVKSGQIVDVTTYDPNDGAPVGRLVITLMDLPPEGMDVPKERIIPSKYGSAEESDLTVAVYSGKPNSVNVELNKE